jgi:hypothetical protein
MKKIEKIKKILKTEYKYIYTNKKVFLDLYNEVINKENCSGTITTRINASNNYYIIEVKDEE